MSAPRIVIPPNRIATSTITVDDPSQVRHLRTVLHLRVGDPVVCTDGHGQECDGVVARDTASGLSIRLERRRQAAADPLALWLVQALPKGDRFEWIVQKAVELGAARISPVTTRRTVVRVAGAAAETKQARWQRIATEAAQQCGRATLPIVDEPRPLERLLPQLEGLGLVLMPTLAVTTVPLREVLRGQRAMDVTILIGPEGDFSPEEVSLAERYGARPVSLGRLTLRTETAAIAALAMVRYEFSE